jgi:hypothetical protein
MDMACSDDCAAIVLGFRRGNVLEPQQTRRNALYTYPAGSWINAIGISHNSSVITAGALYGTFLIPDKDGNLLAKTKTDTFSLPRSVVVSRMAGEVLWDIRDPVWI